MSRLRLIDPGCPDTMICQSAARDIENSEPRMSVEFTNGSSATSMGTTQANVAGNLVGRAVVFADGALISDLISVSQIENHCNVLFIRDKRKSASDKSINKENYHQTKEKISKLL